MDADCLLRGRRDTFSTSGSICVAGVALSVLSYRCPRKLGVEGGPMDADGLLRGRRGTFSTSGSICVVCLQFHVCMYVRVRTYVRR